VTKALASHRFDLLANLNLISWRKRHHSQSPGSSSATKIINCNSAAVRLCVAGCSLLMFYVMPVNAETATWGIDSADYSGIKDPECGNACHLFQSDQNLTISDFEVANDATTVDLAPPFAAGTKSSWRSRIAGSSDPGTFRDRRTDSAAESYSFPLNESSISFDYCIGKEDATQFRKFFCSTVRVTRELPENNPPEITAITPQGPYELTIGDEPLAVSLKVKDEFPDSLVYYTNSATIGDSASVSTNGSGGYTITPEQVGTDQYDLIVTDDIGQEASERILVTVKEKTVDTTTNTPPSIDAVKPGSTIELAAGETVNVTLEVSDAENDNLVYTGSSDKPSIADVNSQGNGSYQITAKPIAGVAQLTLSVDDGQASTDTTVSVTVVGTMPTTANQDGDDFPDSVDNCVSIANNDQTDSDNDGKGDACDEGDGNNVNLPPQGKPDEIVLTDTSGTQLLDVLGNDTDPEAKPMTLMLDTSSSQLNATLELVDNATRVRYVAAADLTEADSFSYRAIDEQGLKSASTLVTVIPSDADNDGVFDIVDNCDLSPNAGQENRDADALGDACDPDPDADGELGVAGTALASGKDIVNSECIVCHLNQSNGAPQFGDKPVWQARVDAVGGIENLVISTIQGVPGGAMPAFGDRYDAQELTAAVLYLSGNEVGQEVPAGAAMDTDADGIVDTTDNCDRLPNSDQSDADMDAIGDACEATADNDGDGYIYALDDDDSNAKRLPGSSTANNNNSLFFSSEQTLSLGALALNVASETSAAVVLDEAQFASAVAALYPGVQSASAGGLRMGADIIDLQLSDPESDVATVTIQLQSALQRSPQLRTYNPKQGIWSDFVSSGLDSIASAPALAGVCPNRDSANYTAGLRAGLSCIRVRLVDGGPNDADALAQGKLSLIARIESLASDDSIAATEPAAAAPKKSGGGAAGLLGIALLGSGLMIRTRWRQSRT